MIGTGPLEIKHYCPILALTRCNSGLIEFYEGERFAAVAFATEAELYDTAREKILPILEDIEGPLVKNRGRTGGVDSWNWHYIEIPIQDSSSQSQPSSPPRPSGPPPPLRREAPSGPPPTQSIGPR